ncbi:unnamed protein product [Owenia fusiformis]|uniref:RING-type domain-containing protein n=1 Tax=Owenia fusiformis TaxID=6347 RepID=A0A8S4PUK5_OWEFU|nr:unnamed protein product [Owenia fusiformis]
MEGNSIEDQSTGFNRNPSIRDTNWCNRCMDRIIGGKVKVYVPCLHHMCFECVKECHKDSPRSADGDSDCPICQETNTDNDQSPTDLPLIEPNVALPITGPLYSKKKSTRMFNQPTKFQTDVRLLNINSDYESDPSVVYSNLVAENKDITNGRKPENWIMMDDVDGALTNGSSPQVPVSEYNISWCGVCLEKLDGKRYIEEPLCGHIICHKCLKQHQKGIGSNKSNKTCPQCNKENAGSVPPSSGYHIPSALTTTSDVTQHTTKSNSNESSLSSRTTQRSTSTVEEQNWTRSVATGLIKPNKLANEILRQKSSSKDNLKYDSEESMETVEQDSAQGYMDYELHLLQGQKEPLVTYGDPSNSYKNSLRTMNPMYDNIEDDYASRSSMNASDETEIQYGKLLCQIPAVSDYERKYDTINPVSYLSDITFISDSELAVVDHSNKMVRLFYAITFHDSNGNAFQKWNPRLYTMRPNRANSQFLNPVRITNIPSSKSSIRTTVNHCAKAAKIVVADESGKSIQFFDTNVSRAMESIKLDYAPMGIAYNASLNRLIILDKNNGKVQVHDIESEKQVTTIDQHRGELLFDDPSYVACGANGSIIVIEEHQNSGIKILDHDGNFRSHVGREGKNPGEFSTPQGVCTDNIGNIYVADMGNDRIQKFDKDGGFLGVVLDSNDGIKNPMGICVNGSNKMAVTQSQSDIICIYDIN